MKPINRLIRKVRAMERAIKPTIQKTVNTNKLEITNQVTKEQFFKGQDANNKTIIPSYAVTTQVMKRRKGQPFDRVTLRDSGDLYKSISVVAKKDSLIISTSTPYFTYLVDKYDSNTLLGLNDQFRAEFTKRKILPNIKSKFKQILSK